MEELQKLKEEIEKIKERNRRVEGEKAWETSSARKIIVLALTYIVAVLFFAFAGLRDPLKNALVPALAYFLSTFSLPFFRKAWMESSYGKK